MSTIVSLQDAQERLSDLVERAAAGEEIIITVAGRPTARLVPLQKTREPRQPGAWKGMIWVADDFDDPLPPDILAGFMGEDPDETDPK